MEALEQQFYSVVNTAIDDLSAINAIVANHVGQALKMGIASSKGKLTYLNHQGVGALEFDNSMHSTFKGFYPLIPAPTTTELPQTGDWGFYGTAGTFKIAANDAGTIRTRTLV
jgi:hypothetical protein